MVGGVLSEQTSGWGLVLPVTWSDVTRILEAMCALIAVRRFTAGELHDRQSPRRYYRIMDLCGQPSCMYF